MSALDQKCINNIRCLAIDMVAQAKSGHPGMPMGMAPVAHVLWSKFLKFSSKNPKWFNRDRFVLSNGHGCALQYVLLHLAGYDVPMEQLQKFRKVGSITPGHPEVGHTAGVEVTTGPLGQGFANGVGMGIAQEHLKAKFNRDGMNIFDNNIFVFTSDGCLMEGIASEAASVAGHLGLGSLIYIYDDNKITIDGSTELAFTEDVAKRFEAYGWHVQTVEDGNNDLDSIEKAIENAKKVTDKPSIIRLRTIIGFGSEIEGTAKVHGAPLGADDITQVKKKFGFKPEDKFYVDDEVKSCYEDIAKKGATAEAEWNKMYEQYKQKYPELAAELERVLSGKLPDGWEKCLPTYSADDKANATRKLSQVALNKLAEAIPEMIGGSADLTGSNCTQIADSPNFQKDCPQGRNIKYGVREHAMAGISNGLAAYGGVLPFCATFLTFLGYAQGSARLSALSHFGVVYILTHDSIGLGEDGPTHQPIETLAMARATPNTNVFRPADGNEVSATYIAAIRARHTPSVIALTRQNLPQLKNSSVEKALKGGYVLEDPKNPAVGIVATGSEVSLAVEAAEVLNKKGINTRVISMMSWELFEEQSEEYKKSVLPKGLPILSVEVLAPTGWEKYSHAQCGMTTFGSSGPYKDVYTHFNFVPEKVAEKAEKLAAFYPNSSAPDLISKPF
eukprot:gb/GECH01012654.1/.p1 GENE.gb/GECH01012654.1/~~gb/GECH01012654.1/.p1  ORF type:complete len:673 (+),score=186.19 gb/GECH01012654.1/:1-2019(+)